MRRGRTFVGALPEVPELRLIGHIRTSADGGQELEPHRHEHMEICFLTRGAVRWWAGDDWYDVSAGDVYVTAPHEPHGGGPNSLSGCSLYWTQVQFPRSGGSFLGLSGAESRVVIDRLRGLSRRCFKSRTDLTDHFERLLGGVSSGPAPLGVIDVRSALLELVLEVVRSSPDARPPAVSPVVSAAMRIMDANLTEPLTLGRIAAEAGCSVSVLKRRFHAETGASPGETYLRRRVRLASARLQGEDTPVTQIAAELGFSSSQYFATVFKRVTGMTPRSYRHASDTWERPADVPLMWEATGELDGLA